MIPRRVVFLGSLVAMLLAVPSAPVTPGSPTVPTSSESIKEHDEKPDDPFMPVSRADRLTVASAPIIRGGHVSVQVNVDAGGNNILGDAANEPSLAIDPTDPRNLVVGWRQFDTIASNFRQAGFAYSHDGGLTWTFPGVLQPGQFRSDPVLAADSSGTFFYYSLNAATAGDVFISTTKGESWSGPIPALGGDKEWLAADDTGGLGEGNLYINWNSEYTCCAAGTDFTRSTNGGSTYQGPLSLPSKAKWGMVAVGPDGEVYVAGTRVSTAFPVPHLIMKSTNARDSAQTPSFGAAVGVPLNGTTDFGVAPNPEGMLGQVEMAVDRSSGPTRGYVYVLASVNPTGTDPLDVMFSRSTDGGATWSTPLRVNDDPLASTAYQWFGTLSVAPTGRIDALWNDTRNDATGATCEVRYAYSTDAGLTWSASLPVTPAWNWSQGYPNQSKIGDYYQMISDADGASVVYAATFHGEQDIYFLRVGDCNANGRHDAVDIALHSSLDCNTNKIPDECEESAPACSVCATDAACNDGVFCNGLETCDVASSRCRAPVGPACDDGSSCTTDTCNESTDSCAHTSLSPPGAVGQTIQVAHNPTTGVSTLLWGSIAGAAQYNSYRGSIPSGGMGSGGSGPYNHVCLESADAAGDGATLSADPGVPALGTARYYLASGENACAEGPLGNSSASVPRPNPFPCPTPP